MSKHGLETRPCDACGAGSDYLNGYCRDCEVNGNELLTGGEDVQESTTGTEQEPSGRMGF